MSFIIIKLFLVSVFVALTHQNSWQSPNILSQSCNDTVSELIQHCKTNSYNKWHFHKLVVPDQKRSCCHMWDVLDCYETSIKDICFTKDIKSVQEYKRKIVQEYDLEECFDYQYYSDKCTITTFDFNHPGVSWQEQLPLITEIGNPSIKCAEAVHEKHNQMCVDKVNLDLDLTDEEVPPEFMIKFQCCIQWKLSDCNMEMSKVTEECTHKDVIALISTYKRMNEDKIESECQDYPYGSEQCEKELFWMLNGTWVSQSI